MDGTPGGSGQWQVEFNDSGVTGALEGLEERIADAERGQRKGRVTKFVIPSTDEYRVLREAISQLGLDP